MKGKILLPFLIILIFSTCVEAFFQEKGYKWEHNKGIIYKDWKIISENFSHIIYQAPDKELWTKCHSCTRLVEFDRAHLLIWDGRKQTTEYMIWPYRPFWQKVRDWLDKKERPIISMVVHPTGNRILDYEELYYCDTCYKPEWNK